MSFIYAVGKTKEWGGGYNRITSTSYKEAKSKRTKSFDKGYWVSPIWFGRKKRR